MRSSMEEQCLKFRYVDCDLHSVYRDDNYRQHIGSYLYISRHRVTRTCTRINTNITQWFKYHAHTKPHFVWAVGLGLAAPLLLIASPIRRKYLYADHEPIPKVYPLPTRQRDANLTGFDDE